MDFMTEFPSWAALKVKQPSVTNLEKDELKSRLYQNHEIPGSLETLMEDAGVDPQFVKSYSAKYTEQGLRYGLATLLGVGKGFNDILKPVEGFILKYSFLWEVEVDKPEFLLRIRKSVIMAKSALLTVQIEFAKQRSQPPSEYYLPALKEHFGIGDMRYPLRETEKKEFLSRIKRDFSTIESNLNQRFRIAASHNKVDALGYVKPKLAQCSLRSPYKSDSPGIVNDPTKFDHGSIHLDFEGFGDQFKSIEIMACTIIHEASHKWCKTVDDAYLYEAKYKGLPPQYKINNADSYANFAMHLYLKKPLQTIPGFIQ